MTPANYLDTARKLLRGHTGRPRQADLKKAVSAAYYAVFYALCKNSAGYETRVGSGGGATGGATDHSGYIRYEAGF